jgi:hypothetical protein
VIPPIHQKFNRTAVLCMVQAYSNPYVNTVFFSQTQGLPGAPAAQGW